jgi:hypothetical protein
MFQPEIIGDSIGRGILQVIIFGLVLLAVVVIGIIVVWRTGRRPK